MEYSEWLPLLFLFNYPLMCGERSMSTRMIKNNEKYILQVSTGWMIGLCQHCLCLRSCMQREREHIEWFTAGKTCDRVSLALSIWSPRLCLVRFVSHKSAISSSAQNKSTASYRCLCLHAPSCYLKLSFVWAIWWAGSYTCWQWWTEMGHMFSWKCGSVNFLLLYMWKTWTHLPWKATA